MVTFHYYSHARAKYFDPRMMIHEVCRKEIVEPVHDTVFQIAE